MISDANRERRLLPPLSRLNTRSEYLRTKAYYDLKDDEKLPNPKDSRQSIAPYISRTTRTNQNGEFEFFTGRGDFYIMGPSSVKPPEFILFGTEEEHVVDLHSTGPERILTRGAVVLKGNAKKRISEATVRGYSAKSRTQSLSATTDAMGKFEAQRGFANMRVFATNADKSLAGIIDIDPADPFVLVPVSPTATVIGKLVDRKGKPLADKKITYGILFHYEDNSFTWRFGGECVTRAGGTYTLSGLIVGEEYQLQVATELDADGNPRSWLSAGSITPSVAGKSKMGKRVYKNRQR